MNGEMTSEPSAGGESFASLFESAVEPMDSLKEGEIISGKVVKVSGDNVVVDVGYKSEGMIATSEFIDGAGEIRVSVGDQVDVLVEAKETDDGILLLSKEKADRFKVWDEISDACEQNELIKGTVTARVKGGLSVAIRGGVKAFLPGSQVDLRPVRNLDKMIGQMFDFKVIKFNKKRGNIVLSRRVLLEQERDQLKASTLQNLEENQVVTGTIKNITEYGAFVDLGGIDGLLHITDMSWGRVNHPSEVFSVGNEVTVKVLKYNSETERVSLGLKQITDDPWSEVAARYPTGTKVTGKVVSLADYGAFIEMEQGVEGLIHVSEMSWTKPKHPSKLLEEGQEVTCLVLDVDTEAKRISLGLKQLEQDPWEAFTQAYNPGDVIRGVVRSITEYGVFVGISDGVDGMVHKSDLSWTQRINNPADLYQKGDEVEAIILSVNNEDRKVSLGIKQLYEDPWNHIPDHYPEGTVIEVRVISISEDGAFAEIERGVEGLISVEEVHATGHTLEPEQKLKARVSRLDEEARTIVLAIRDLQEQVVDPKATEYQKKAATAKVPARQVGPSGGGGATLGDVLKAKLDSVVPSAQASDGAEADAGDPGEANEGDESQS